MLRFLQGVGGAGGVLEGLTVFSVRDLPTIPNYKRGGKKSP